MFSNRIRWDPPLNRLTIARRAYRGTLLDLTVSNPTRVGIAYPSDALAAALARGARAPYEPDPRGLASAREALAEHIPCSADDLILTASTSEAYAFLFKLLADPGDEILTTVPGYPLLEHLAATEQVILRHVPLELHRRWELDPDRAARAVSSRTRAFAVVNPNNPTGSFVRAAEAGALARLGIPLIADEVFLDYPLESAGAPVVRDDILAFSLGGLSKSAGLPHFKLGWIRVSGPGRDRALAALELIADSFLSLSTPVQMALPEILRLAPSIRGAITARLQTNLALLRARFAAGGTVEALAVEGGWSAVLRVPCVQTDEDLALALLDRGVLVQPGYFFDFPSDGFLVVSLLTPESTFEEGLARIDSALSEHGRPRS